MSITVEEAKKLLRQKIKAKTSLVDFAKYVDIPGVPVDEENIPDSRFQVVETPLAFHHELILDALGGLKSHFPQILLITHIEDVKDRVEQVIEVRPVTHGFSEVWLNGKLV